MADDAQSGFLATYGGLAQDVAARTGLDPSVVLGQIAQETGWGARVQGNNIFGISPGGTVKSYPTVQDAASDYVNLIRSRYPNVAQQSTPSGQAASLVAGGYNTADPNYATSVAANAHAIQARGPTALLSDKDLDAALLAPAPRPQVPVPQTGQMSDAELDRALLGTPAVDASRPSSQDFRYVAPYTAPDGSTTTIAPEDWPRWKSVVAYDAAHPGPTPKQGAADPVTGLPVQLAAPATGPVAQSLGAAVEEGREPGVLTQAAISLPTDTEAKRRIAAAQLFPNEAPLAAQSRVFYGPDGRLAAVGQNGAPFYVEPPKPVIDLGRGEISLGNPLQYAASGVGPALPIAGGIAGGVAGAPGSLGAGPAFAAGGAAAGDLARQYLARWFDPAARPPPIDLGQTAKEALLSGAGQFAGGVLTNALAPNALRVTPGEINILRAPPVMADTRGAYARAGAQGVPLTPGQATGLPSLLQYEDAATTMPQSVDRATAFYRAQGNALQHAGQNMLGTISPNTDKTDAALMFSQGAEDATRAVRQQANAAARPFYQTAEAGGNMMTPDLAQLTEAPAVQTAMKKASVTYQNLYGKEPPETPDFALWDLTKRQLDSAYTVAQRAGENTDAMAIDNLRQRLVNNLDTAFPSYAQARAIAAPGQRLAAQLQESGVGNAGSAGIDERARAIVAPVFNQNPRAIAQARDAFAQAGREDEWNAGVRSYIQDAFDRASQSQQGLNPAMLRRQVWGNTDNRDAIQAALTPDQYAGFDNFMKTVEDVARTYPMNSLTATRLNARGALQGAASQGGNVRALDAATTVLSPFRWGDLGNTLLSGTRARMVQNNMSRIVGHLFEPDGLQYLEAMAKYSPGSQRAIEATAQAVGRAVAPSLVSPDQSTMLPANPLQPRQAPPLLLAPSAP